MKTGTRIELNGWLFEVGLGGSWLEQRQKRKIFCWKRLLCIFFSTKKYTNQLLYHTPPRDVDLRRLNQHLPNGSTLYCIPELVDSVRLALSTSSITVVGKSFGLFPTRISEYVTSMTRDVRARMDVTCRCQTDPTRRIPSSWERTCAHCHSYMHIHGMTESFLRSLLLTAQRFWCAKPWLKLRLNHIVYIDDSTTSGFHFLQLLGKYIVVIFCCSHS